MTNKIMPSLVDVKLHITDIEDLLKILTEHERNTECVDDDRMKGLINMLNVFQKKVELTDFHKHIEDTMPEGTDEDEWDKFYTKYWNIRYGGKAIVIENNAGIYSSMLSLIKEQIDDYL